MLWQLKAAALAAAGSAWRRGAGGSCLWRKLAKLVSVSNNKLSVSLSG